MRKVLLTILALQIFAALTSSRVVRPEDFKRENHPHYNPKTGKVEKQDRSLSQDSGAVGNLNDKIEALHLSIKDCIDEKFELNPQDIPDLRDILFECAGENFSIVIQTYNDVMFEMKEITKERIKNAMQEGFCDDILFMCIEFFKVIELFIKLDYDIEKSLEYNRKQLGRKINEQTLDYLITVSGEKLEDYNRVRNDLIKEREFVAEYFEKKKIEYINKYPELKDAISKEGL